MAIDEQSLYLGGWAPDDLRSTIRHFSGVGSNYDLADAVRFVQGVARVVRRREAIDQNHNDPKTLSVFLLKPDGTGEPDLLREPMLDSGHTTIAGKAWFVNPVVACGRAKNLEAEDANGVFRAITESFGLGDVPAAVVDPRGKNIVVRFYPQGLNDPDVYDAVRMQCNDFDLQQVCEIIDRVYQQCLKTPDAQPRAGKLWNEPAHFRPQQDAEHRIQLYLKSAFASAFPTCRVYDEFAGTMGRADLHLEESDPLNREIVTFLAVLELKVLRSFSESGNRYRVGEVSDWVEKGVKQAGQYRRERGHLVAVLCCFDMRETDTGDQCFINVGDLSRDLQVTLRRWFLYASSELARDFVNRPQ